MVCEISLTVILQLCISCGLVIMVENELCFPFFFLTSGHWGWKPGGDGGRDSTEKAQTQKTSGQGLIQQRWGKLQGQEETWSSTSWETLPKPPQTHQADEHHYWYRHQLQRWVRTKCISVYTHESNLTEQLCFMSLHHLICHGVKVCDLPVISNWNICLPSQTHQFFCCHFPLMQLLFWLVHRQMVSSFLSLYSEH